MGKPARAAEPQPIVIYATPGFDGYTYELDPHSERRLQRNGQASLLPSRISIAFDSHHVEAAAHEQYLKQAVALLTGSSVEALASEGGVEVWHSRKSELLWKWPRARR